MNKAVSIFCKIFVAPLVGILLIKEVKGRKNIPGSNFILASNHQSYLDIVACGYICVPRVFTFIGQVDKGKGIAGMLRDFFYFLGGVIRLNRKDDNSKKQVFNEAVEVINKGSSLVIYPEGTRTKTGEIQQGKWGVAKIFLKTGAPVLPLGINGAFEMLSPSGKVSLKRMIRLNIGKPIYFREEFEKAKNISVESEEYKNLCISITNRIMEEIKKLVYEKD
jgi:1-acyl-sn-glycerol-3-phosphate acyltransferase